jgi:hypothetical protein
VGASEEVREGGREGGREGVICVLKSAETIRRMGKVKVEGRRKD